MLQETRTVSTTFSCKKLMRDNLSLFLNGAGDIEAGETDKAMVLTAAFVIVSKVCQASAPVGGAQGDMSYQYRMKNEAGTDFKYLIHTSL